MDATATPPRTSARIDVTLDEFARRLAAFGHDETEIRRLWDELAAGEPDAERALGLGPMIAVYLGALLVVAAFASFVGMYWKAFDPWGVLGLGVAYLVGFVVAGEVLGHRGLEQPGAVLRTAVVGFVAAVAYSVERIAGIWPDGANGLGYFHHGLTGMVLAGLAGALVLLVLRPDPLVLVPLGLGSALLGADLAELVLGNDTSDASKFAFVLPVGLAWIAAGLWLDVARRRPYAVWAHWAGLVATLASLVALMPTTLPGFAAIGAVGALWLFFSAFVRHWSFTVVGAAAVLVAVSGALGEIGGAAPVAIAVLGLLFIYVGLRWSRWREPIRDAVLARLPAGARALVTRLAP